MTNRDLEHRPTFALAGAGSRGTMFAEWVREHVGPNALVAVAEPQADRRAEIAKMFDIPSENQFSSWKEMLARPKLATILLNTTMDADHYESAILALEGGYHMLLEKPMGISIKQCAEIEAVRRKTQRVVSVCHSLRYHPVYSETRKLIRSGRIGDLVSLDQLEAVEIVHMAHSFVRGNWGNEGRSTYMLLAKSTHDIDIIADLIDVPCKSVSSYGSLTHFRKENAPADAPAFCVEGCPHSAQCPYDAVKVYGEGKGFAHYGGYASISRAERLERLKTDRYGRCVYRCDNDVVDHQVVAMEFENDITATFTMTAFTPWGGRFLRVHGTKGYIEAKIDQNTIDLYEFWDSKKHSKIDVPELTGAHGGADGEVMRNLIEAVKFDDPASVLTTTSESLRTFAIVEGAERSRREGRRVELAPLYEEIQSHSRLTTA